MSESKIAFIAKFPDIEGAEAVENIFRDANEYFKREKKDLYLHDYLKTIDKTMGIRFDSWWVPETFQYNGTTLLATLVGSPSGGDEESSEQDIVIWLKRMGAVTVSGNVVVDGGGDIFEIDI